MILGDAHAVVVFRRWDRRPVFHYIGDGGYTDDGGIRTSKHTTRCGITYWLMKWHLDGRKNATIQRREPGTLMRHDHAAMIGRPCSTCRRRGPRP